MATVFDVLLPGRPAAASPHRRATIRSVDGRLAMTIPITDAETDYDDLGQEWAVIDRPLLGPVTARRGGKLIRATLRMHFIAKDRQSSVDDVVLALKAICDSPTPIVISYGSLESRMTRSGGWVVTNGTVHVAQRVQGSNDARWADAELQLLEAADFTERRYFAPSTVTSGVVRTTAVGGRVPATYTWRQGDTLYSVALQVYGDAARWTEIGDANGIRDPARITAGTVLRLP